MGEAAQALRKQPIATRLFTDDNAKIVTEVLGHDDEPADVVEQQRKHLDIAQRAGPEQGPFHRSAIKSGAASSSDRNGVGAASSDGTRNFHAPLDNEQYSLAGARGYLLPANGYLISIHRDKSWMELHKSHNATWYDSNLESLVPCLEWG